MNSIDLDIRRYSCCPSTKPPSRMFLSPPSSMLTSSELKCLSRFRHYKLVTSLITAEHDIYEIRLSKTLWLGPPEMGFRVSGLSIPFSERVLNLVSWVRTQQVTCDTTIPHHRPSPPTFLSRQVDIGGTPTGTQCRQRLWCLRALMSVLTWQAWPMT